MAELAQPKENAFLAAYDEAAKTLNEAAPGWLRELRAKARGFFAEHGLPGPKNEAWRYTKLDPVRKTRFRTTVEPGAHGVTRADLEPYTFPGMTGTRLVFVNGHYVEELSDLGNLPDGVTVTSLAEALARGDKTVEAHLGKHAVFEKPEHAFTALNTLFAQDGLFVHVPRNVAVEEPIHVLYVSKPTDEPTVSHPRTLIVVDEGAQAPIVETYFGEEGQTYLTNAVTEIVAGDNSHPDHYRIQRESEQAYHVSDTQVHQGRDAGARTLNVTLGADMTRNETVATLAGEGGHLEMNGLFAPHGEQHVDNHTRIEHEVPHCTSHELYKGILDGQSRGVFTGLIHVHKGAQKTDAIQHNPNLILTKGALVDSKPQLEIYADDVKCTHGSTIGQLDQDSIFYLESRGIDRDTARTLLTYAFAGEVLDTVKLEPVREKLKELILARLPSGERVREVV